MTLYPPPRDDFGVDPPRHQSGDDRPATPSPSRLPFSPPPSRPARHSWHRAAPSTKDHQRPRLLL